MLAPPDDLSDAVVERAVSQRWGINAEGIEFCPVGFGSHHWVTAETKGRSWFVTVDDLDTKIRSSAEDRTVAFGRLRAALVTARALRDTGGEFVVAPVRTRHGEILERITERYAMALYPLIEGQSHQWGTYELEADPRAVTDVLVTLHRTPVRVVPRALVEDFVVPHRRDLRRALDEVDTRWTGGRYAEPTRRLLARFAGAVEHLLARYDQLVDEARRHPDRMVIPVQSALAGQLQEDCRSPRP